MSRLLLVGTMVSLAGGCFVPMSQGLAMQQDLRLLRDRLVAVEDRAEADDAMLREKVAQAQKDADRIAATMSKVDAIARRADANFGEELVNMRQGLGSLQGRLETLEHQGSGVPQASEDIKALRQDVEALQQANKALQEAFQAMGIFKPLPKDRAPGNRDRPAACLGKEDQEERTGTVMVPQQLCMDRPL